MIEVEIGVLIDPCTLGLVLETLDLVVEEGLVSFPMVELTNHGAKLPQKVLESLLVLG